MRKMNIILLMICILLGPMRQTVAADIFWDNKTAPPEKPAMYAKAYALMDGESGRCLLGENMDNAMANASTTKIMTCILALENADEEAVVTVSSNAVAQPKVHLGMKKNEQFYMRDLLYGLMLESYNDCAVAIAEHIDQDVEAFAKRMNEKAKELGCEDTHFVTPNGLDKEDGMGEHHTTAKDLCRIMKYCAWESPKSERFLAITQTKSHSFSDLKGKSFYVNNHNLFLNMMDCAITGKTGYTAKAGYCYVAAVEEQGRKYCIALLACGWPEHKNYKWADARKLFTYGLNNYQLYSCDEKNLDMKDLPIRGGCKKYSLDEWGESSLLSLYADNGPDTLTFLKADWDTVEVKKEVKKAVALPVQKGDVMGTISITVNGEPLFSYDICSAENLYEWDFSFFRRALFQEFVLL